MKKTLIALAAVAVSSAAMAQVTISGNVDARWQSEQNAAGNKGSGFLISDSQLHFTATEDLGGGLKATARFTLDGMVSDGTAKPQASTPTTSDSVVNGDGVFVQLSGGFGSVTISSLEAPDYLPLGDFYTSSFTAGTVADRVTYKTPTISGFDVSLTHQEGGAGTNDTGGGAGAKKVSNANVFEINYAAGPLTANVGMLSVDKNTHATSNGGNRVRVGYNFGVAAVSYGQVNEKAANDSKIKTTGLNVSVPLGNITLGAQYATRKAGTDAATKGTAVSATYALSKRTSMLFEKVSYEVQGTGFDADRTRVTLRHSF
jgi:predicted porin